MGRRAKKATLTRTIENWWSIRTRGSVIKEHIGRTTTPKWRSARFRAAMRHMGHKVDNSGSYRGVFMYCHPDLGAVRRPGKCPDFSRR